ncbi:MAG: acyl-CoA synthetase FdrA [Burkholderiales bacterium]|nr:MAG: acyl-CoA synthetase FdrA [Burkholderiales bacterium]
MPVRTEVVASFYQDSVILMRAAARVRELPGVREVAMFMGTPANHELLEQIGLATEDGRRAGPNDLIITVHAEGDDAAAGAIAAARAALLETRQAREASSEFRPRSLDSALRMMPEANLVSLSIPGPYVKAEALAALRRGLHLFIFSDNVPVADEIEIKREAVGRNRLCMGPDQGTAYLGGVALGFANVVARGRVGCVAASGTGLQAVVSRLAALGEGVSHAIGVGGRDLSEAVGGLMTLKALDALAADAGTEAIVLVSKPPHPSVLERVNERLAHIAKPTVVCCIGAEPQAGGDTVFVETLDAAADAVVAELHRRTWLPRRFSEPEQIGVQWANLAERDRCAGRRILGLYTGGTLAYETDHLLRQALGPEHAHRIVDLGDDRYTVGRPHPMIDPSLRSEMIVQAGTDPTIAVLLVDLVIGQGAHENPAPALAAAANEAKRRAERDGRSVAVLAYVLGTAGDPQDLEAQTEHLRAAGIHLFPTNADAARFAAMLTEPRLHATWMNGENT